MQRDSTPAIVTAVIVGGVALVAFGVGVRRHSKKAKYTQPEPKLVYGIPFAQGTGAPMWPLITDRNPRVSYRAASGDMLGNGARRFGAPRSGVRMHAGTDLYADVGDIVVATEPGEVVALRPFFHGAYAIYVCTKTGVTVNYGEVEKNSWKEFGIQKGSKVKTGDPLARINLMSGGSRMLHFETYKGCRETNQRWYSDRSPPSDLLNPADYLLRAAMRLPSNKAAA